METDSTSSIEQKLAARYIKKYGLNASLDAFLTDLLGEGITVDGAPLTVKQISSVVTWIVGEQ